MIYRSSDRDRMLDSRETQRRLPDVTVLLPDAGHILPPQTERVLEFLESDADPRR